jgi:hypothetical protein
VCVCVASFITSVKATGYQVWKYSLDFRQSEGGTYYP